jgi:hypothetical protein
MHECNSLFAEEVGGTVKYQHDAPILALVKFNQVLWFKRFVFSGMDLGNDPGVFRKPGWVGIQTLQSLLPKPFVLWRRDINIIKGAVCWPFEKGKGIHLQHFSFFLKPGKIEILADGGDRQTIDIKKADKARSPAERFDANAASAGEQVQQGCGLNIRSEDIEKRLLGAVGNRPGSAARDRAQLMAPRLPGDNA